MTEFSLDWPHGWQTRDGRKVEILKADALGRFPIIGIILNDGVHAPHAWKSEGHWGLVGQSDSDIINAPAPKHEPRKWWVVVYRMACRDTAVSTSYDNEKDARKLMDRHDVVPIAFTRIAEGDGLEGDK